MAGFPHALTTHGSERQERRQKDMVKVKEVGRDNRRGSGRRVLAPPCLIN